MLLGAVYSVAAEVESLPPSANRPVDFAKDVEPLLKTRCQGCHGKAQQLSGLRLDQAEGAMKGGYSGAVIKPGASAESSLIHRIAGAKQLMVMPPAGKKLTPEEIGILRAWIDQGAKWPATAGAATESAVSTAKSSHWAFQPVRKPPVPAVRNAKWTRNPVDAFILARLDKEKIAPSDEAGRSALLRRVSLDLTGLPPTPKELAGFLADHRPDAYERQVDRLLASPHYGEKWARHWLDRARYADSDGYEKDWVRPHAWRYRQEVIEAFNRDQPFDQFTIEQIAGDLLPNATVEQKVATGFHRNTLTNREGGVDNNQFRFDNTTDRTNTVAALWLGLTVGCAQCHDHKFDPISQKDHYQLFAFFDNLEEVDIDAPLPGEMEPYLRTYAQYRSERAALLKEYNVEALQASWEKEMLETAANPGKRTDWDLAWDCLLKLTEGGDGEKIIRIAPEQRTARERDVLTDHFIRNYHFAIGPKKYAALKFKELDGKLRTLKEKYPQLSQAMTVAELPKPKPTYLRVRGDYKTNGIEVQPAGLSALPPIKTAQGTRATRLDLARWLVSPEHPLTSRVTVNWIWQEIFGQGLVKSSEDFGTRGDRPSHPELLDWLASSFMEDGWSVKRLIRQMVTSATYRQSSKVRPELQNIDPGNTLLARQSRLRLPAELIRDSALRVSGLLSEEIGGKSIRPPQPAGVAELGYGNRKENGAWTVSEGKQRYRRGMYIHFQRSTPYPLLMNFDAPKANVALCRRQRSNTPLQALNLLNDPVFMEAAEALARRVLASAPENFDGRLQQAYLLTFGREPADVERQLFRTYFERQRKIFDAEPESVKQIASSEVKGATPSEFAAWASLSSVLLNSDEFITRE